MFDLTLANWLSERQLHFDRFTDRLNEAELKEKWLAWAYLPLIDFKHRTSVCNRQPHSRSHQPIEHRLVLRDVKPATKEAQFPQ
jgi:hypothetical protein